VSVAILLPDRQTLQVRQALSDLDEILIAHSWMTLESIIRTKPVSMVLFDPSAGGMMNVASAVRLLQAYPSLPFIAYVLVDGASLHAVAELSKAGLEDVVLVRVDDSLTELREKIERFRTNPLTGEFVTRLRPLLATFPNGIEYAVEHLFKYPERYPGVHELAVRSGVTVSCLYRSFEAASLASPKKFLTAARVLRGYYYLMQPTFSVKDIALKAGYRKTRVFAQHVAEVFGVGPSSLRTSSQTPDALEPLMKWLGCSGTALRRGRPASLGGASARTSAS
jgi:AraC-like DNA-binding protein